MQYIDEHIWHIFGWEGSIEQTKWMWWCQLPIHVPIFEATSAKIAGQQLCHCKCSMVFNLMSF
jgi:hypothetical protein